MPFSDPIVAGNILIRDAIRSPNYVTGTSGWTINADGSAEFSNVVIVVQGANGLQVIRQSDGALVGSIDSNGNASFAGVYVNSDNLYVNGNSLAAIVATRPRGMVAWGEILNGAGWTGTAGTENPALEVSFEADATRLYEVRAEADMGTNADGDQLFLRIRDGFAASPTVASTMIYNTKLAGGQTLTYGTDTNLGSKTIGFTTGTHRLLLSYGALRAAAVPVIRYAQLSVHDVGPNVPQVGVNRILTTPVNPVQTYTQYFTAFWSGTYDNSNNLIGFLGNEAIQGQSPDGSANRRAMIGWFPGTIGAYISGSTILGCSVTLYANHWYNNSGGTAVIGTHNAGGSRPGTFSGTTNRIQRAGWPKPGMVNVDLGVGIGNEFLASTTSGIVLGPGPTTSFTYYGRFDGVGMGTPPILIITYQK